MTRHLIIYEGYKLPVLQLQGLMEVQQQALQMLIPEIWMLQAEMVLHSRQIIAEG